MVAEFLDTIMPEERLLKTSKTPWKTFFIKILIYHEYTSMFYNPSLRKTRLIRWTKVCLALLIELFLVSLFYGMFYPDNGTCESYSYKSNCLILKNSVSGASLCKWEIDVNVINGGKCTLNPPPYNLSFILV